MTRIDVYKKCRSCQGFGLSVRGAHCKPCNGTGKVPSTVKRTAYAPKWGDVVIEMTSAGVRVREKKRRTWYGPVSYGAIMQLGAKLKVEEDAQARRARRRR